MRQQGRILRLKASGADGRALWAYRYRDGGRGSRRVQRGGFASEQDAREALERALETVRRAQRAASSPSFAELVGEYLAQHDVGPRRSRSCAGCSGRRSPRSAISESASFARRRSRPGGKRSRPGTVSRPPRRCGRCSQGRSSGGLIDVNPAKQGVDNPQRRRTEKRPFESWGELGALAARLGARHGPMVIFAAATGLRPSEWIALERRDVDRDERVVYVRRAFSNGRLKPTKTEGSVRAVPLQAIALAALDQSPSSPPTAILFPAPQGGYFDLHNFRNRYWKPAQLAAGIRPLRRVYDLRHTFAHLRPPRRHLDL